MSKVRFDVDSYTLSVVIQYDYHREEYIFEVEDSEVVARYSCRPMAACGSPEQYQELPFDEAIKLICMTIPDDKFNAMLDALNAWRAKSQ